MTVSNRNRSKPEGAALVAGTAAATLDGFLQMMPSVDVPEEVGRIRARTLVVTSMSGGLGSVAEMRAWQERIAGSRLVMLDNDSHDVAASDPDETAKLVRVFLLAP